MVLPLHAAALNLLARTVTPNVAIKMAHLPRESSLEALREIGVTGQATMLPWIDPDLAAEFFRSVDQKSLQDLLRHLEPKDSVRILARLDPAVIAERMQGLPKDLQRELNLLLRYPKDSAGALMDPRAVLVRQDEAATTALEKARKRGRPVLDVLVVEADGRLVGMAGITALALAEPGTTVASLMKTPAPSIDAMCRTKPRGCQTFGATPAEPRRLIST